MKPINANEADYERFEILGHDALFTCLRIDRKTLPEGLYALILSILLYTIISKNRVFLEHHQYSQSEAE